LLVAGEAPQLQFLLTLIDFAPIFASWKNGAWLRLQKRAPGTIRKYALLFRQLAPFGLYLTDFTLDTRGALRESGTCERISVRSFFGL